MNRPLRRRRIDVLTDLVSSFGRDLFEGVREFANQAGWIPVAFWQEFPLFLREHQAEADPEAAYGLVGSLSQAEQAQALQAIGVLGVNTSGWETSPLLPTVRNDDFQVGVLAARHFLDLGYRRFGYIGIAGHGYSRRRWDGFATTLRAAGHTVLECGSPDRSVSAQMDLQERQHFLSGLSAPTAVFCCNDIRARHLANDCRLLGIEVPRQVAILGVDDDPIQCALAGAQLSSVRLAGRRVGYLAAQRLVAWHAGTTPVPHILEVPPLGVLARESTDFYAVEDREAGEARRFLESHACQEISIEDVLRHVPVSRRMLERRFRKAFGKSMHQHLRDMRLARAREMLASSQVPIKQIALQVGFGEANYFDRVFRRHCGVSPRQYRQIHHHRLG